MNSNWTYRPESHNSDQNPFLDLVSLKCDGWPRKTIRHLFYATPSVVRHFVAICEFKLGLESWNTRFGSKLTIFWARVTLEFDGWRWKTIRHLLYTTPSMIVHHFVVICEIKLELRSENAQIGAKFVFNSVTLTFDLWPWPYARTSLLPMVITPENFMMIGCSCHRITVKKVWQTDGQKYP